MRKFLDKSCRENQNTHFTFKNFFSENRIVHEIMSKNMKDTEGPQITSQNGAYALHARQARLYARTHMHTTTRLGKYTHARAHKPISTTYCFSTATMIRERASVLPVHCLFCFIYCRIHIVISQETAIFYYLCVYRCL